MAANVNTVNVATRSQVEQTVMSYVAQGFIISTQNDDTTTLFKKKEFNVVWAVIGFFACVIPLMIYCIVYSMEKDQMVVVRLDPAAAALPFSPLLSMAPGVEGLTWSEDRRYWWDSTTWIDAEQTVPRGVQYTEDGRWWDGQSWRAIPAATGTSIASSESAPGIPIKNPDPNMALPRPLPDLVRFDRSGWQFDGSTDTEATWLLPGGGGVGLYLFPIPPDLPRAQNIDGLRVYYRDLGVRLVELDVVRVAGIGAVRTIVKGPTEPDGPLPHSGLTYVAAITFPFERLSFVVKAQCSETGVTGMREAVIFAEQMAAGTVKLGPDRNLEGWVPHAPPGVKEPLDANLAEDASFDSRFPEHPLSRVRAALRRIEASLLVDDLLLQEAPFPLPGADNARD